MLFCASQRTLCPFEGSARIAVWKQVAVYCSNRTKHTNKPCGKTWKYLHLNTVMCMYIYMYNNWAENGSDADFLTW
jgi:hypothetical protein